MIDGGEGETGKSLEAVMEVQSTSVTVININGNKGEMGLFVFSHSYHSFQLPLTCNCEVYFL